MPRAVRSAVFVICALVAGSLVAADAPVKPLRVGLIGLDTSHVIAFTDLINTKAQPGSELADLRVVAGFPGVTKIPTSIKRLGEYTEQLRGRGIEIVDSIPALLEKVDVVLLESVDGNPHLEQVLPVLKARKRVFVDKPIAASLVDAIAIFEAAKKYDMPMFSSSALRYCEGARKIAAGEIGEVLGCDTYGNCSLEPSHSDLYWYGIHGVEALYACMGTGCESVTRLTTPDFELAAGRWRDGRIGTFRGLRKGKITFGGTVFGTKANAQLGGSSGYEPLLIEVAKYFRTGKPPVSAEETIEMFAFMEASDESKRRGGAPVSIESVLKPAQAQATARLAAVEAKAVAATP